MAKWWRVIGHYLGVSVLGFEATAGLGGVSPFVPDKDAKMIGIRTIPYSVAATTLMEGIQVHLTCTTFTPNMIEVAGQGGGVRTAVTGPNQNAMDFVVDQQVKAGVPIVIEARNMGTAAPVTPALLIMALFEG